jgi:hypothetical protein
VPIKRQLVLLLSGRFPKKTHLFLLVGGTVAVGAQTGWGSKSALGKAATKKNHKIKKDI